jgi:hypothetical protein
MAGPVHREAHVITLVAHLAGRAPRAPLVVIPEGRDPQPPNDALQQPQHVLGREITAGEHHHIKVAPAHQPRDKAARGQQRTDIGDQRGQVQRGEQLPRLFLLRRATLRRSFQHRHHRRHVH